MDYTYEMYRRTAYTSLNDQLHSCATFCTFMCTRIPLCAPTYPRARPLAPPHIPTYNYASPASTPLHICPISLLRLSPLRIVESKEMGNSLWT